MTGHEAWAADWTPRNPLDEGYHGLVSRVSVREHELAADVLGAARRLVLRGWSSGAYARDGDGVRCSPRSPNAERWSLYGAIVAAQPGIAPERWDPEPLPSGGAAGSRIREIALVAVNFQLGHGVRVNERWPLDLRNDRTGPGGGAAEIAALLGNAREWTLRQAARREALAARCARERQADARAEAAAPAAGR